MKKMIITLWLLMGFVGCQPALATMSSTIARETLFTGDGSTTAFVFTFPIVNTSDLEVWLRTTATGAQTQQTETTHYSVSATNNNYASGGTVTMVTAPASTQQLLLLRATPQTQAADIGASGILLTLENALDKQQRQLIDLQEEVNRCLKFPKTDATTLSSSINSSVDRASQYLGFTSTGVPTVLSSGLDVGTVTATVFGQSLVDDSTAAEARGTLSLDTDDAVEFAAIIGTTGTFSDALIATTGTFSGMITANAGLTLGAGDDLIGSSTSDITLNTDKFTVAGATGNTAIDGTLDVNGVTEVTGVATLGDGSLLKTSAAPSTDAMIVNKKYVDDHVGDTSGEYYVYRDVDGTPTAVYTKYFTGTLDSDAETSVAHGITGIDNILSVTASCYHPTALQYYSNAVHDVASATNAFSGRYDGTSIIIASVGSEFQGQKYKIRIDYII